MVFDSPWLAAAVGFPLVNAAYLTVAITALKTVEHAATGYRTTYLQKLYVDAVFKVAVAAAFLVAGPIAVSLVVEPVYAVLFPLGGAIYLAQNRLWQWYTGGEHDSTDPSAVQLLPLLVVPAAEEVVFRGGIGLLVDSHGEAAFLAVSTVAFALSHAFSGKKEVAFKLVDGVVYGVVFLATGSVLASALVHTGHNFTYAYVRGLVR